MLIDGWDIQAANARQARFVAGHHALSNSSSWNTGSNRPVFQRNQMGFKDITLELWVKGNGYQEIVTNTGVILSHLLDTVELAPDWTTHKFKAILNKYSVDETAKQRFHVLKLEFLGYEYSEAENYEIEVSTVFSITNIGTAETPVILELVPLGGAIDIPYDQMEAAIICDNDDALIVDDDGVSIATYDYDTLVIQGLCSDPRTGDNLDITIRNITPGKKIAIDGTTGLILEEGEVKIDDVDIWALPTLQPGENQIKTNNNWLKVTVIYEPRYM